MNAHTSLVNACIALIQARGGMAFKLQTGVLPVAGRFVHAGRPGAPDVVGVLPFCPGHHGYRPDTTDAACMERIVGRMIAVEVKTGTGRLSKIQQATHEELRKRGALVLTVRNIAELQEALR